MSAEVINIDNSADKLESVNIKIAEPLDSTDYNPNNQILSLPFIGSCLVQRCNVDPLAALASCTINAGFTTPHNSGLRHGIIAPGAVANLNILQSNQDFTTIKLVKLVIQHLV